MNAFRIRQLTALFAAPLLLAPSLAKLQFAPSEGSSLRYSLSRSFVVDLEGMEATMTVEGEERPGPDMSGVEATMTDTESWVFVDEYLKMGDASPLLISRTYESLSSEDQREFTEPKGEAVLEEVSRASDLEGRGVLFAFDEDSEEWSSSFAEGSEDDGDMSDELLEGLEAEVFFVALLPEEGLEAGATWEIDPRTFFEATNPVGEIPWDKKVDAYSLSGLEDLLLDNLEGKVSAELVGIEEEDGVQLATIHFTAELKSEIDNTKEVEEESEREVEDTEVVSFEFDLEGDLVWDVVGGHARALKLRGPIAFDQDKTSSFGGERPFETSRHNSFSGELRIEATIE